MNTPKKGDRVTAFGRTGTVDRVRGNEVRVLLDKPVHACPYHRAHWMHLRYQDGKPVAIIARA